MEIIIQQKDITRLRNKSFFLLEKEKDYGILKLGDNMKKRLQMIGKVGVIILISMCFSCTQNKEEVKKKPEESIQSTPTPYIDTNPITVGLYTREGSSRKLAKEYTHVWVLNQDIGVFSMFATKEETIGGESIQTLWPTYWNAISDAENYKIGYHVQFTTKNGEKVSKTILTPKDAESFYSYVQVYLYDDIHQIKGVRYSHVEEMKEDTILTSFKLTGSTLTHEITSSIQLTAFTYTDTDDFDQEGNYRGKSTFTTEIKRG